MKTKKKAAKGKKSSSKGKSMGAMSGKAKCK